MENSNIDFTNTYLQRAGILKRFLNYLIDLIVFGLFFGFISTIVLPTQMAQDVENINPLLNNLLSTLLFGIFVGIIEGVLKGKTFGKYLTNTITLNEDGSEIDFMTGFKRGLIKCVPFCAFSALSSIPHPWQDTWSNTVVIDVKLTQANINQDNISDIGKQYPDYQ